MSMASDDDQISSLGGYKRYASSRSNAFLMEPSKPKPNLCESSKMSRVVSSPANFDQRQDNHYGGTQNDGLRMCVTEDGKHSLEDGDWDTLFNSNKNLALTRAPSALPSTTSRVGSAPGTPAPQSNTRPPKAPVSISQMPEYGSRNLNTKKSVTNSDEREEPPEAGVIWVRSFSAKNGNSLFVGKPAPELKGTVLDDDGSLASADSQELYALRQMMEKSTQDVIGQKPDNLKSLRSKDSDESSCAVSLIEDVNTLLAEESSDEEEVSKIELSESESSESEDEMDEFGNFTVEDLDDSIHLGVEEDDDESISDESSRSSRTDDKDVFDAANEANSMRITEVNGKKIGSGGSVKTTLSEISGSFDEDGDDTENKNTKVDDQSKPKSLINDEEPEKAGKKKKRIFKLATGLGRKKTSSKTLKTEPATKSRTARQKKLSSNKKGSKTSKKGAIKKTTITPKKEVKTKRRMKSSKMKSTGIRIPKNKREKKKRVQLQTIRVNDVYDDLVPRKGDPGVHGELFLWHCFIYISSNNTHMYVLL